MTRMIEMRSTQTIARSQASTAAWDARYEAATPALAAVALAARNVTIASTSIRRRIAAGGGAELVEESRRMAGVARQSLDVAVTAARADLIPENWIEGARWSGNADAEAMIRAA